MISREEVKKLAELSLLAVSEDELDTLTGEIGSILEYVSEVDSLVSEAGEKQVKPALYNVMRDDVPTNTPGEFTQRILDEAPRKQGGYIQVKKIL